MPSSLPRRNPWVLVSLASPETTAFPEIRAGRLPHYPFRGLLDVYSRYGLHTRRATKVALYTEELFSRTPCTAAPIATGWSDSCRMGFAPTGRPCLCTAHRMLRARLPQLSTAAARDLARRRLLEVIGTSESSETRPLRLVMRERFDRKVTFDAWRPRYRQKVDALIRLYVEGEASPLVSWPRVPPRQLNRSAGVPSPPCPGRTSCALWTG